MNPFHLLPVSAALLLMSACGQTPLRVADASPANVSAESATVPDAVPQPSAEANLPKQALTPDWLFRFLVAEVAGQRGALGLAQSTYFDLARETRDPRVARRATEVSLFARNQPAALEAARLWAVTEPGSSRARQTLATLLLNNDQFDEAEPLLRDMLKEAPANLLMHLSALMGKSRDTLAVLALVERLAADYPALPEAYFAIAQAASNADRFDAANAALKQADQLRPGWEPAALLRAQLLSKAAQADALAFMRDFLAQYPAAREIRLSYARTLVNASQFPEALAEFKRLTQEYPRNAEVSLAAGLLSLQLGDVPGGQALLMQTLEYGPREPGTVYYYLGQAAEHQKQPDVAATHYAKVLTGNYVVSARIRQAVLLARADRLDEALSLLAATEGQDDAQHVRLFQVQGELLRNAQRHQAAFDVLSAGIQRFPDAPDLLYDRALAAEKIDKLDILETDLRRVIALRPDDAQAYNALGYTLADRTDRIAEAISLLDRALALAPDDAFILDSVGWAQYRAGNLGRAQEYLERAYRIRPDPEIAAHLGEVMWMRGQRDAAGQLWQTSLQSHPQNEILLETLRRLQP